MPQKKLPRVSVRIPDPGIPKYLLESMYLSPLADLFVFENAALGKSDFMEMK